jgi:hypothetical protein
VTRVLVSHRADDRDRAQQLVSALRAELRDDEDAVVVAREELRPGVDGRRRAKELVADADAVVAVIGPAWLGAGASRPLRDPDDEVRLVLAEALARDQPVVPALFDGARRPRPTELPDPLKRLADLIPTDFSAHSWQEAVEEVVRGVSAHPSRRPPWYRRARNLSKKAWAAVVAVVGLVGALLGIWTSVRSDDGPQIPPSIAAPLRPTQFNVVYDDYLRRHANDPRIVDSGAPRAAIGDEYRVDITAGKGRWEARWSIVEAINGTPVPSLEHRPAAAFEGPLDRVLTLWAGPCDAERAREFGVVFELWREGDTGPVKSTPGPDEKNSLSCRADE